MFQAQQIIASMGLAGPHELKPAHIHRRTGSAIVQSYAELFEWLEPGELLAEPPEGWAADWRGADADRFVK